MNPTTYFTRIPSPLGNLTLVAKDQMPCGLYFEEHSPAPTNPSTWTRDDGPRFATLRDWLTRYFAGQPIPQPPLFDLPDGTEFQRNVWRALQSIPASETRSYSDIAETIGSPNAVRAVGAAIGRNPFSILIPCHRVIGSRGAITGYAGGLDRKRWLLAHEGVSPS